MIYDDIDGLEEMLLDLSNVSWHVIYIFINNIYWYKVGQTIEKILLTNLWYFNLQVGANENNTNSVEASETMSTNSASSPIPYSFNHSSSIDLMNENETKRRHRSSTDDNKMVRTPVYQNSIFLWHRYPCLLSILRLMKTSFLGWISSSYVRQSTTAL